MLKNIEPISKKSTTKTKNSSAPSISENKKSVDIVNWFRKDTHEDPRIESLIRLVRWQGRFIVLLILLLAASVVTQVLDIKIEFPNQEAIQDAPPLEIKNVDYNAITFQDGVQLNHGSTVTKPSITMFGQIYDGLQVIKKWPDIEFLVNNASVPISGQNSQFKIDLNLSPGPNIIETAVRINGVLYNRKQKVINYQLKASTSTSTNENVSTQATVPASR